MANVWKRLKRFLAGYGEEIPALVVVTPLVKDPPPKPLTIITPVGKLATVVKRKAAKRKRS